MRRGYVIDSIVWSTEIDVDVMLMLEKKAHVWFGCRPRHVA